MSGFHTLTSNVLCLHIKIAQDLARVIYDQDHSNDPSGAEQEDIPSWARVFFQLFDAQLNSESIRQRTARTRIENRVNTRSLIGAQAPLGYRANVPATLRTETLPNDGAPAMRAQVLGEVEVERVQVAEDAEDGYDREDPLDDAHQLVEGLDDVAEVRPPPRQHRSARGRGRRGRGRSGSSGGSGGSRRVSRRNEHLTSFSADHNDPSTRFSAIEHGYEAIAGLTHAMTGYLSTAPPGPPRGLMEVGRDYSEIRRLIAETSPDEFDRAFYASLLQGFREEATRLSNPSHNNESSTSNNNGGDTAADE